MSGKTTEDTPAPGFRVFDFSQPGAPMFEVFFGYEDAKTTFTTEAEAIATVRKCEKLVHDAYRRRMGLDV